MNGFMKEWMETIKKGIPNIDKIFQGFLNDVRFQFKDLSEDKQNEIARRRVICKECPFNSIKATSSNEYKELHGESYKTNRTDNHCSLCGCVVNIKTASLESNCGIEEYNKLNKSNIPLKWTKYEG
jgi:hypothetical protein